MKKLIIFMIFSGLLMAESCYLKEEDIKNRPGISSYIYSYALFYCVDGYKWVSFGNSTPHQMFQQGGVYDYPVKCKCKGKK